jgi:serine/threonine-protein kinase
VTDEVTDGPDPEGAGPLRLSLFRRVVAACDRYEASWRAGHEPRIEDHLAGVDGPQREALLRELLALELELRQGRGERPGRTEYVARFPDQGAVVDAAFAEMPAPSQEEAGRPHREPPRGSDDRGLLLALLAFQNNFIDRDALLGAFAAWVADKARPLGRILRDRGALDADTLALLEALVSKHLRLHGDDPERSLAALSSLGPVRGDLERVADILLRETLARVATDRGTGPDVTRTFVPGPHSSPAARFRILRFHRRGGLGQVHVARDEELGREVALKEILPEKSDSRELRSRFVLEAEINGGLEHPGIVPVYSLGTYDDGRPFYAMRFVEGDSLKEAIEAYHRQHPRPDPTAVGFRQLLGRFVDVCEAIAFAHSKGVMHRDLKPHNVMLGRYGETLLIDWGLAKATGRRAAADHDAAHEATLIPSSGTRHEPTVGVVGTPAFMSPEQARGEVGELGPATDVYGLGAVLYVALTGKPPVQGEEVEEILDAVRRGAIASPRALNPRVPRSLEAVCLKALALNPGDRYTSARALADDVERWLADEPVSAWREPWSVRIRRRMRRHRSLAATAATAGVMAIVGLSIILAIQSAAAARERKAGRLAQQQTDLAMEAIEAFYTGVSRDALLKQPQLAELRRSLLKTPMDFYRKLKAILQGERDTLAGERGADERTRHRLAKAYFNLAVLTSEIGSKEDAFLGFERARDLLAALAGERPEVSEYRGELAAAYNNLGNLSRAVGRPAEALACYERARDLLAALALEQPANEKLRGKLAKIYRNLGLLRDEAGRPAEALACYKRAHDLFEALTRERPDVGEYRGDLAATHNNLGLLHGAADRPSEALTSFGRAHDLFEALTREWPAVAAYRHGLAANQVSLGTQQVTAGRPAEALACYERARDFFQALTREWPADTGYRGELAEVGLNLGHLRSAMGQPAEALACYERARDLLEALARDHPTVIAYKDRLAKCLVGFGLLQARVNRPEEALASFRRARGLFDDLARGQPNDVESRRGLAGTCSNLGNLLVSLDRTGEARPCLELALDLRAGLARERPTAAAWGELAAAHDNLGLLLAATERSGEAVVHHREAREILEGLIREQPNAPDLRSQLGGTWNNLGLALERLGLRQEAASAYRSAVGHQRAALDLAPRIVRHRQFLSNHYRNLAKVSRELRRPAEATAAIRERQALWPDDPTELYDAACDLALLAPLAGAEQRAPLAAQAVEALRAAVAAGWRDVAWMSRDPDLAALRDRDDYRRLVATLWDDAFPADPFARGN